MSRDGKIIISERQPLHASLDDTTPYPGNHQDTSELDPSIAALIERRKIPPNSEGAPISFAIDPVFQNTAENPYRETTVTVPHLVRRVPSCDLVPKPWTSFRCVIIGSYISVLFCLFTGAAANKYAWRAKQQQSKGLYGLAQRDSRYAVILIYISIALGLVIAIIITIIVLTSTDYMNIN